MESIEELAAYLKLPGHLPGTDGKAYLEKLKVNFNVFVSGVEQEGKGSKEAFYLLVQATFKDKHLTHDEKVQIENQLKDLLKTIDLVAITALPGGTLFFILVHFLKLNKYVIPSVFLKEDEQKR